MKINNRLGLCSTALRAHILLIEASDLKGVTGIWLSPAQVVLVLFGFVMPPEEFNQT